MRRLALRFGSAADVGCGTGRFLADLAAGPALLFGIDSSPDVLDIARARLAGRPVTLLNQDMRRLNLPRPVDLVTCHNQTINYVLTQRGLLAVFSGVTRSLNRGGAFLFDFIARPSGGAASSSMRRVETLRLPDFEARFDAAVTPGVPAPS